MRRIKLQTRVDCDGCGAPLWLYPNALRRSKRHFCSKACHSRTQQGEVRILSPAQRRAVAIRWAVFMRELEREDLRP